jgi:hypothetical protein
MTTIHQPEKRAYFCNNWPNPETQCFTNLSQIGKAGCSYKMVRIFCANQECIQQHCLVWWNKISCESKKIYTYVITSHNRNMRATENFSIYATSPTQRVPNVLEEHTASIFRYEYQIFRRNVLSLIFKRNEYQLFWRNVLPLSSNTMSTKRFGGTYCLYLQSQRASHESSCLLHK